MNSYQDLVSAFNFAELSTESLNIDSIPEQAQFEWSSDVTQIPRDVITFLLRVVNNGDVEFDSARAVYQNQSQPLYIFRAPRPTGTDQDIIPITPFQYLPRETKVSEWVDENNFINRFFFARAVEDVIERFEEANYDYIANYTFKAESGVVDGDKGIFLSIYPN